MAATTGLAMSGTWLAIVLPLAYCLIRAVRLHRGRLRAKARHGAEAGGSAGARPETSLDPQDAEGWAELRAEANALLDASLDRLESAREGRVWTPLPEQMRAELGDASPPSVPVGRPRSRRGSRRCFRTAWATPTRASSGECTAPAARACFFPSSWPRR